MELRCNKWIVTQLQTGYTPPYTHTHTNNLYSCIIPKVGLTADILNYTDQNNKVMFKALTEIYPLPALQKTGTCKLITSKPVKEMVKNILKREQICY